MGLKRLFVREVSVCYSYLNIHLYACLYMHENLARSFFYNQLRTCFCSKCENEGEFQHEGISNVSQTFAMSTCLVCDISHKILPF